MRTADFSLSAQAQQVLGAIRAMGARPLLVGGCVRDTLMGHASADVDIEVYGVQNVDHLVRALREVGRVDEVGKSFGVLKLGLIDVSLPRRDSKTGDGHRGFSVVVDKDMTPEEAAGRRDFTMNAMMFDPFTETLIDPYKGRWDIEAGILRHTTEAFAEDPLRVLRGVQFAARFGFALAPETALLCSDLVDSFSQLASERVWAEWEKVLLKGRHFVSAMCALRESGWIVHFPELREVTGEETVAAAMRAADYCQERKMMVVLASLVVESGKQKVASIGAPKWLTSASAELSREVAIMQHAIRVEDFYKMARRLSPLSIKMVTEVRPDISIEVMARQIGVLEGALPALIGGHDLIKTGREPGPLYSEIFKRLKEAQDDGQIKTTEEAWALVDAEFPL